MNTCEICGYTIDRGDEIRLPVRKPLSGLFREEAHPTDPWYKEIRACRDCAEKQRWTPTLWDYARE